MSRGSHSRRVAALAVGWFVVSTLLLVGPLFFWLGNHVEPRIAGLPFALVYVLGVVALNFGVLAALYVTRAIDHVDEGDG